MARSYELRLVDGFKKMRMHEGVILGPGDDCAVMASVDPKKEQLVFGGDMLVQNVHFDLSKVTYAQIGHKAVARTLSDIAAMGARPLYLGFSLALPKEQRRYVPQIKKGALALLDRFSCSLVGGDLSRADAVICDTWCVGAVAKDAYVRRNTMRTGDAVFVSGKLGGSYVSGRHMTFVPRIDEARLLCSLSMPTAMIDITDGFVWDLWRMIDGTSCGIALEASSIPVHTGVTLDQALYDGEDYELLFTAPQKDRTILEKKGFFFVGTVTEKKRCIELIEGRTRKRLHVRGYTSIG
jgi:thiamine-monophosphate kinase